MDARTFYSETKTALSDVAKRIESSLGIPDDATLRDTLVAVVKDLREMSAKIDPFTVAADPRAHLVQDAAKTTPVPSVRSWVHPLGAYEDTPAEAEAKAQKAADAKEKHYAEVAKAKAAEDKKAADEKHTKGKH